MLILTSVSLIFSTFKPLKVETLILSRNSLFIVLGTWAIDGPQFGIFHLLSTAVHCDETHVRLDEAHVRHDEAHVCHDEPVEYVSYWFILHHDELLARAHLIFLLRRNKHDLRCDEEMVCRDEETLRCDEEMVRQGKET